MECLVEQMLNCMKSEIWLD